eukprot:7970843-Prorocentrum_lima.AAC.1
MPSGTPEPYWSDPLSRMVSPNKSRLIASRPSLLWMGGMMTGRVSPLSFSRARTWPRSMRSRI